MQITRHRTKRFDTAAWGGDDLVVTNEPAKLKGETSVDRMPTALKALTGLEVFNKASISCRGVEDGVEVLVDFADGKQRVVFILSNPEYCDDAASKAIAPILREYSNAP